MLLQLPSLLQCITVCEKVSDQKEGGPSAEAVVTLTVGVDSRAVRLISSLAAASALHIGTLAAGAGMGGKVHGKARVDRTPIMRERDCR